MLEEALGYAREHGLPKVYVLIDEYDNFTNQLLTAYKDPLYEQVTTKDSFLRILLQGDQGGYWRSVPVSARGFFPLRWMT